MKEKFLKNKKGITLIALVVTIVVLIILAVISINAVLGEDGLIKQAERGVAFQANAEAEDEKVLSKYDQMIANAMAGIGGGSQGPTENIDPETGWDLNKVNKVTSEDNVVVPVPKGYTASTVDGEKRVDTGFVIKEGTNGAATSGTNEFVWVPVPEISDIYDETNNAGQLWEFVSYLEFDSTIGDYVIEPLNPPVKFENDPEYISEPNVVTIYVAAPVRFNSNASNYQIVPINSMAINVNYGSDFDAKSSNLQEAGLPSTATVYDFLSQLQNDFNKMIQSVKKYGGFYIGRYQTGNLSGEKGVVQKENEDLYANWYKSYRMNKTIGANENVETNLVWGCQWDATLRWMRNFGTSEEVRNYPVDATLAELTKVNNIYDMAKGAEWTMQKSGEQRRLRGNKYPASAIHYSDGHDKANSGSRATLHIAI